MEFRRGWTSIICEEVQLMIGSTILDYFIARRTAATVWTTSRFPPANRSNRERDFSRSGWI